MACLVVRLGAPPLLPSQTTNLVAQEAGVVGILLGRPEMLQKPVLEKPNTALRELENSGLLLLAGPEELTLQALSPKQRGYRVFIDRL